ncbi:phosphoribosyl-ATP pyrophosphohydrolase [Rhodobium orientis]|uniref:Phosphoribosyl-ATP pyrophosphatase n=1 Tax=Rhodobium orientis TaxID=34017 RepID=A0A327JTR6_9HYPH|nr:phosphoribosyl-ATP diphosphatase [Rhodobium orientis]MBB4304311.1 phosphoribosyl-ATP pyrophosphohydrolase [Rhodobium orientis]MBK5948195.1 phosphoribosyl-ATP diphosphatase [Rhodobium orientis]RAI28864.1 phosphoribosyl-ATP diphosphatase [Rhodobium orientis]
MTDFTLKDLAETIAVRARSDDEKSYTRKLIGKGISKCAQKLGEEAVEAAIAAVERDHDGLRSEAADVLYHLLVVLEASGVTLDEVMAELEGRTGRTGLEEKASRAG